MSDPIIIVENLGKKYRITHQGERQRYVALRDVIAEKAKGLFGGRKPEAGSQSEPSSVLRPPSSGSTPSSVIRLRPPRTFGR